MATYSAAHSGAHNYDTAYCWTLLIHLTAPPEHGVCPFVLPDVAGLYCKAYLESTSLLRLYFRFKQPVRSSALGHFSYPGSVVSTTPWIGSYWDRVDLQLKALSIWELGLDNKPSRNHRTCKRTLK